MSPDNGARTGKLQVARIVLLVLACACAVAGVLLFTSSAEQQTRVQEVTVEATRSETGAHVLLVMSYDDSDALTPLARAGVCDVLDEGGVAVDVAYIDAIKRPRGSEAYVSWVKEMADKAAANGPYDAVICADDEALTFFEDHHTDMYADAPGIFFNVNDFEHARAVAEQGYATGILEQSSVADMLRMALAACPGTTRVLAIVDGTPSGIGDRAQFDAAVAQVGGVEVEYLDLDATSRDAAILRTQHAGDDAIVFLLDAFTDTTGSTYTRSDSAHAVANASARPVFGLVSGTVGTGLVGASFTDPEADGRRAAAMCLQVLGGADVSSLPVVTEGAGGFVFDAQAMERYGLDPASLPPGTTIINREPTLMDTLKASILPVGLVAAAIVLLLVATLLGFKRSKSVTRATVQKQNDLTLRIYSDPLTGLPNVQWLDAFADIDEKADKVKSVIKLDFANFRSVNELHGRAAGDKVIREVAKRLEALDNEFLVHCGGDVFLIGLDREIAWDGRELETIDDALAQPVALADGDEAFVDAHIGVANRAGVLDFEDMINGVDYAVREAKMAKSGPETVFYDAATKAGVDAKKDILALLKRSVKNENFSVSYEPQVELESNEVIGYEAGVRLKNNLYSPEQFMPVAEQSGQVIEISRIAAKKVVQQLATWRRRHKRLVPVMLPLAKVQLEDDGYVAFMCELLAKQEVPAYMVAVEVTDELLSGDEEKVAELLSGLKEAGVPLVFTKFGSSAESLAHLSTVPVNMVKLDASYTASCTTPEGEKLFGSLVEFAHGAGKKVIAGNVATPEQLEVCERVGCDVVQGPYFSAPELPEKAAQYKPAAR